MTALDGTQERTLDPPDNSMSDAEMRECERAARYGFDCRDDRAREWINEQLADTPTDFIALLRCALAAQPIVPRINALRDRYVAECSGDYLPGGSAMSSTPFQIEHSVPLPDPLCRPRGGLTDTLRRMSVGDSVLLQFSPDDPERELSRAAWHVTARRINAKIVTRQVDGGIRVWRIA